MKVTVAEPWNETAYDEALTRQRELARGGERGWLLFCCPPTVTLGRRATPNDVLVSRGELARRGVRVLDVDRGGEVTYHGPGQIIGFPFGSLEAHVGDPRGVRAFVVQTKQKLERLIATERKLNENTAQDCAGVWILDPSGARRKIVSIGLRFARDGMAHGFALNVEPLEDAFSVINPCGERGARPASLFDRPLGVARFRETIGALVDILGTSG